MICNAHVTGKPTVLKKGTAVGHTAGQGEWSCSNLTVKEIPCVRCLEACQGYDGEEQKSACAPLCHRTYADRPAHHYGVRRLI